MIPVPNFEVKRILSGTLSSELDPGTTALLFTVQYLERKSRSRKLRQNEDTKSESQASMSRILGDLAKHGGGVTHGLSQGDMKTVSDKKLAVEESQQRMWREAEIRGEEWKTLFFRKKTDDEPLNSL
ncbi:uncharacterized protein BDR25DRAFT_311957 [Lindgomyces ingoldianus]|uniref:Uncharacterized protein n=1 Tax=Lindgomyces ingoldianus TaxID=673940 RepID=A0ACB6R368_9PLEO|nr:uncharacterized protein BDR25DRAFT_311957 [Lindgomyces ingoldianus]KAF2473764.1 hypothetical protein BDR25DRAFT_311957 [Lindgomyces ingoldianus]